MRELFRLTEVHSAELEHHYHFELHSTEIRVLEFASKAEKDALMDLVLGVVPCRQGRIEIVQGERRLHRAEYVSPQEERRRKNQPIPLAWLPIHIARAGRVGWVSGSSGLISNLKVWENVTLPLWYHARHDVQEAERRVSHWLERLGIVSAEFADFMASPPANLQPWQRKLAGLLRALVQHPQLLVIDVMLFDDIRPELFERWQQVLDHYAEQGGAVLVFSDKATALPWQRIE